MNQKRIEPDLVQMASIIDEVVSGVKQDSIVPVVDIFMVCLESHGYTQPEILNGIAEHFYLKDFEKYKSLIAQLEKTVEEARKIDE
ncbi:MAG: hypothetical protein AAGG00_09255 [Cyanobacteria bacterium P01_H01_bin.150]